MTVAIPASEIAFAREVDRLGALGLSQDEIAARVGLSKSQVRYRLSKAHLDWSSETRVRFDITHARLEEALAAGELAVGQPEEIAAR